MKVINKLYISAQIAVLLIGITFALIELYNGYINSRKFENAKACLQNSIGVAIDSDSYISTDLIDESFASSEDKYFARLSLERNCDQFFSVNYYDALGKTSVYSRTYGPIGLRSGLEILLSTFCINLVLFAFRRWLMWLKN